MGTPFNKIGGNPIVLGLDGLKDEVKAGLNTPDEFPALVAGSSRAVLGDPETASWMERTTAADGAALIESVRGNTLRWNQLNSNDVSTATVQGITFTNNNDGSWTIDGEAASDSNKSFARNVAIVPGHYYLVRGCPTNGSANTYYLGMGGYVIDTGNGGIWQNPTYTSTNVRFDFKTGVSFDNVTIWPQLFDLTAMFGAGNEPATVAEFEALFPDAYYPYDAGSLLPVRMEGVETVGFNQWDEEWEVGSYSASSGEKISDNSVIRSTNAIPVFPETEYYFHCAGMSTGNVRGRFYDADGTYIGASQYDGVTAVKPNQTFKTPVGARYIRFALQDAHGNTYKGDICINLSDPSRNGTYEPYWSSERTIPAATYFPDGLRSAGSVYDELRADAAITRVGALDLGTLTWERQEVTYTGGSFYGFITTSFTVPFMAGGTNFTCAIYDCTGTNRFTLQTADMTMAPSNNTTNNAFFVRNDAYTDAATFKTAMSGVMLYYELAIPITTTIDPPLPLSYRTGAGGTERVMVAEGTTSAPPIFATRYPLTPEGIRDRIAATVAPVEQATAQANHAIGELVYLGWTLYKVTSAIATGETITPGTNVTETTVAAELAALSE